VPQVDLPKGKGTMLRLDRRSFLGGALRVAASGALIPNMELAGAVTYPNVTGKLPEREHILFKGAYIITMDQQLGDIESADIHIRNGAIIAVGRNLVAPGARVINAAGNIVTPGLVETHWHLWTALMRGMAGDEPCCGYFPTSAKVGNAYTADDMHVAVKLATAEALNSGITTVHDWCHNIRTPAHADEDLRALRESGLRGRFSYGPARSTPITQISDLEHLTRLARDWPSSSADNLLSLGLAWRGVQYLVIAPDGTTTFNPIPEAVFKKEYDAARVLGLPITLHCNVGANFDRGHVATLERLGLLYPDLNLVHMISSTPEEIAAAVKAGCSISSTPFTEMRTGYGFPKVQQFLDAGARVGLGVDTTAIAGDANMFEIMKGIQNVTNATAMSEYKMSARKALALATIEGARVMNLEDQIGSLIPGKRADLIMINTNSINLGMFTEAAHMVVSAAQPANVDTVIVDGRILKEKGRLTAVDVRAVIAAASVANEGLRDRAHWST